jgi:hypothetical protein
MNNIELRLYTPLYLTASLFVELSNNFVDALSFYPDSSVSPFSLGPHFESPIHRFPRAKASVLHD